MMIHGTDYECATAQFLFEVSNGILNPNLNTSNHDFHYKRKKPKPAYGRRKNYFPFLSRPLSTPVYNVDDEATVQNKKIKSIIAESGINIVNGG
jgi:hypothetical protein